MMAARDLRYTTHVGKNEHLFNCEPYIIYSISPQQTIVEDKTHTPGSPETFLHMARRLFLFFRIPFSHELFSLASQQHGFPLDKRIIVESSHDACIKHVQRIFGGIEGTLGAEPERLGRSGRGRETSAHAHEDDERKTRWVSFLYLLYLVRGHPRNQPHLTAFAACFFSIVEVQVVMYRMPCIQFSYDLHSRTTERTSYRQAVADKSRPCCSI